MKSAVLSEPNTISSADTPNLYVSESAQRRLDALRSSVEVRLEALEAALADPARGDALETLILDLARVACEESQAAAAHACADTRLEAEMHIGRARAAAQVAVDQEHASSAESRRALDDVRQQLLVLQDEREEGLRQARETFDLQLAHERATRTELEREAARLERSAGDAENELTTERALTKSLRQELERIDAQVRALKQEQSESSSVRERLESEMARSRDAVAQGQQAHADTQTQLALERNAVSELRRAAEKSADQLSALERREAEARGGHEHITKIYDETVGELRREREAYAQLRDAQRNLQARVDADQSASAEIQRTQSVLQQRLTAEQETVKDVTRQLASLQERFDAERAASAGRSHAEVEVQAELAAERARVADATQAMVDLQNRFDAERAATAELRRAIAQAEARMQTAVDTEHALRAQLSEAAAHGKQKSNASEAEAARAAAAAKQVSALTADLEAERRLVADLRSKQGDSEQRWENERSSQVARISEQITSLTAKLEAEQRLTTELHRKQSDLEARVAQERATNAELRQDMVRSQERSQSGNQDVESVREALGHARAEVQGLRDELEAARTRVESVVGERADAERLLHESESRLKRAVRDRDELAARLGGAQTGNDAPKGAPLADGSKAVPAATPLTVLPHPAVKSTHRQAKAVTKSKDSDWVAVRTAPRYGFGEQVAVQVNGTTSHLCDLAVGGCQVLSPSPLKPNQTVKVTFAANPKAFSCTGKVVWAKLEAPALGRPAGYRAGVQFSKPDQVALEAFIVTHRATALV